MSIVTTKLFITFIIILGGECNETKRWKILVLAQFWLPTNCKAHLSAGLAGSCQMPTETDVWAVHGVWPSRLDAPAPLFCHHPSSFRLQDLTPMRRDLEQVWPDIYRRKKSFWESEWAKHGSCLDLPAWNTPNKYLQLGVYLRRKIDLKTILHKAQIQPSNTTTYKLEQFENVIQKSVGSKPKTRCFLHEEKQYIKEVHICLSKELKTVDCNFTYVPLIDGAACKSDMDLIYGHFKDIL